mmetsp:Transcript_88143/g.274256  ORF Transcript_88143/g.274256 Transcript_88143/m.274256 type:complete len:371 (-) Transcript_88143:124-1236(-)
MSRGWSSRARLLRHERAVRRGYLRPRLPEARALLAAPAATALLPAARPAVTAANTNHFEPYQCEERRVPDAWEELDSASLPSSSACCSAPGAGSPLRAAPAPAAEHETCYAPGAVGRVASSLAAAAPRGEALWEGAIEKVLNTFEAQCTLLAALVKRVEAGPVPAEPPPAGGELLAVVEAITKQITAVNARLDACVTVEHVEPLIAKLTEKAGELVREASVAFGAQVAKLEKAFADQLDTNQFETNRYDSIQDDTYQAETNRHETNQHETNQFEPRGAEFFIGQPVRLNGLRSVHLNGVTGIIAEWVPSSGRFGVLRFDENKTLAVAPRNLVPVVPSDPEPPTCVECGTVVRWTSPTLRGCPPTATRVAL